MNNQIVCDKCNCMIHRRAHSHRRICDILLPPDELREYWQDNCKVLTVSQMAHELLGNSKKTHVLKQFMARAGISKKAVEEMSLKVRQTRKMVTDGPVKIYTDKHCKRCKMILFGRLGDVPRELTHKNDFTYGIRKKNDGRWFVGRRGLCGICRSEGHG